MDAKSALVEKVPPLISKYNSPVKALASGGIGWLGSE